MFPRTIFNGTNQRSTLDSCISPDIKLIYQTQTLLRAGWPHGSSLAQPGTETGQFYTILLCNSFAG